MYLIHFLQYNPDLLTKVKKPKVEISKECVHCFDYDAKVNNTLKQQNVFCVFLFV